MLEPLAEDPGARERPDTDAIIEPDEPPPDTDRPKTDSSEFDDLVGRLEHGRGVRRKPVAVLLCNDGYFKYVTKSKWHGAGFVTRICAQENEAALAVSEQVSKHTPVVLCCQVGAGAHDRTVERVVTQLKTNVPHLPVVFFGKDVTPHEVDGWLRFGGRSVLHQPTRGTGSDYAADFDIFLTHLRASIEGAIEEGLRFDQERRRSINELSRLVEKIDDLRGNTETSAVSLGLLEYVAENVDRAILFLRRREDLIAIGAFGNTTQETTLTEAIVGRRISLDDAPVLQRIADRGAPFEGDADGVRGLVPLFERIGRPRSGSILLIPVRSVERVVAVLYGDNGNNPRPLMGTDALQIVAYQAGLMLENIALRRLTGGTGTSA